MFVQSIIIIVVDYITIIHVRTGNIFESLQLQFDIVQHVPSACDDG